MYRSTIARPWRLAFMAALAAVCAAQTVHAADSPSRCHHHRHPSYPQASLQAQAVTEVAHDTVRITLATEISETSQDAVSRALSETLARAMAKAKENAGDVKVSTGNYRIWPMNDKQGQISNWRGRGEIYLESKDFDAASSLAASLEGDMAVAALSFFVSPQRRAAQEESLLVDAAGAFRQRAQALAQAMGYADYRIRSIDLGGTGAVYEAMPRMAQAAAFKAADAAVPLEPGTESISVTVQGSVFLLDEKK